MQAHPAKHLCEEQYAEGLRLCSHRWDVPRSPSVMEEAIPKIENRSSKKEMIAAETQRLTRLYEQKQAALAALKKSLLHQAFTGEL
jgi:type I restriction enzyme S subunit